METVAGGPERKVATAPLPAPGAWRRVAAALGDEPGGALKLRQLPTGHAYEVTTSAARACSTQQAANQSPSAPCSPRPLPRPAILMDSPPFA